MSTIIYLIRHGETEWNKLGKFQGTKDISLSENGLVQAEYLSKRLYGYFDYVYTSPLKRAFKTAEILAENSNLTPIICESIKEINFGEWEGLTVAEIKNLYSNEFDLWRTDKSDAPICGGEGSLMNASIRGANAVLQIVHGHPGKKIALVAHGGIIKAALIGLFDLPMTIYHKLHIGNTSITKLIFNDEFSPIIDFINDTSHL
jgi:probable phosphoglycerate mutase